MHGERVARRAQGAPPGHLAAQRHSRCRARLAHRDGSLGRLALEFGSSPRSAPTSPPCSRPRSNSTPGRVRSLLRPRPPNEIAPSALLDAIDVSDAEMLVEFVDACRSYANELAVSEVTARTWLELQHYLETADKGAARCAAAGRRRRPAVPAIAGRSRDPLLQDGVRRGLRRASGQGGRDCRAARDRSSASPCGPEQRAIAAPRLPLPPH